MRHSIVKDVRLLVLALLLVGCAAPAATPTAAPTAVLAAAASLLTNRLPRMMLITVGIAVFSSLVGMYASYYFGVASGAAIVLTCTACFGLAWGLRARRSRVLA